jgi:hypothetical protein
VIFNSTLFAVTVHTSQVLPLFPNNTTSPLKEEKALAVQVFAIQLPAVTVGVSALICTSPLDIVCPVLLVVVFATLLLVTFTTQDPAHPVVCPLASLHNRVLFPLAVAKPVLIE